MANEFNGAEQESLDKSGIDSLPPKDRKETEEILAEIAGEGTKDGKPAEKPAEVPPKEEPKAGDKPKEGDEKPKEVPPKEERRSVSLVPAWQLKSAQNKWEKEKLDLEKKLADLSNPKPGEENNNAPRKETPKEDADLEKEIEKFADENGIDSKLAKGIVALANKNKGQVPVEVSKAIEDIQKLNAEKDIEIETIKFSSDFESVILPLIKAEYGDDVPKEVVAKIKDDLKTVAYTPEYMKIGYSEIYKGQDRFRGIIPPKKRGSEGSRGGTIQALDNTDAGKDQPKKYEEMTEDDIKLMSDDEFEKFSNYMATSESKKK